MTYEDIIAGGLQNIQKMIELSIEETHQLEFKQKQNPHDLELSKDDRRALGESLSGFANAIGGVLVIGVQTDRPNGVDRAIALKLIDNVEAVADRYRAYAIDCIAPPLPALSVNALSNAAGAGVIAIQVPQGNARPHMSMAPSHQRYYRRVADSFLPMLHYEIDEMMRLKSQPSLEFRYKLMQVGSLGNNKMYHILFGLKNISKMTAKHPFISYLQTSNQPSVAEYGLDGNGRTLWPRIAPGASPGVTFAATSDQVIHPGQEFFISKIDFYEKYTPQSTRDWGISKLLDGEILKLKFEYGCEDCPIQVAEIEFSKEDLMAWN